MARRPRREDLVAIILAPLVVVLGIVAWVRKDDAGKHSSAAQTAPRLDVPIPADTQIQTGRLRNHLRYFVRRNGWPEGRAELRLVVNAGSMLEADDQRGLAHAVEHMVFRGTKRFPGRVVENYLESVGMRGGSDINATTSQDETVFHLTVPTDRLGVIDTALAILADMAHNATFDPVEARQEAGVVMSEWRSRSDAGQRLYDERTALLLAGSLYANHPTIGDTAVLRRFDVGAMQRFYADWYRPELMAVVAVGDFDAQKVERLIMRHFAELPTSSTPRTRPTTVVTRGSAPRAKVLTDPEATASRIALWRTKSPVARRKIGDYRSSLVDALWRGILGERLDDAADRPGSPVLETDVGASSLVRALDADVISAQVAESRQRAALELLAGEVGRLARFGVTKDELDRSAAAILRARRGAVEWSDNSDDLADGLVDEFLTGDVHIDRESAFELTRVLLPSIGPQDILVRARSASIDSGATLIVTQPAGRAKAEATPQDDLIGVARLAFNNAVEARRDSTTLVPLVLALPVPGKISSERHLPDVRVFDWTLANGMRVILKPTRFTYDQIEFRMFGPGGSSLATDAEYPSAYLSDGVIRSTGVGPLSGRLLSRRLDSTSVEFSTNVRDDGISLSGSAAPRDLDLFFQLLYLHFTAPRADTVAFRRYKERLATYAYGRRADPDAIFTDSVSAIVGQHGPRALRRGARFAASVDLHRALQFWNDRMTNAAGFTLVITGDFALDRVRPLVARYLASLPAGAPEHPRAAGPNALTGVVRRTIVAGIAPRARTQIALSGAFDGSNEASEGLSAAADVAELALMNSLRERLGGTYSASVHSAISLLPPSRYSVTIDFEASPDRIDSLVTAAFAELNRLRTTGPTDEEVEKIRAARTRDRDGDVKSNSYWASELLWHARMGWPLNTIATHQDEVKLMSKASLRAACDTYLRASEYVQVTMYPKATTTP